MSRSSSYVYDPNTGKWTSVPSDNNDSSSGSGSGGSNKNDSSGGSNLTSSTPDSEDGTGVVEKKYNSIELNTLEGTLNFIVTEETIKLKAGDTVNLNGLGKHLSGSYYVKDITRQISSSGYSHSATLIKTDFGKSLKVTSNTNKKVVTEVKKTPSPPQASTAQRTYTVKKGDSLWKIAKQFYGNGALYTKIFDANTNQVADPNQIYIGQVFVIP